MNEKSPMILNRATRPPRRKPPRDPSPEAGAWRSLTIILAKMREQIAALATPAPTKIEIGNVVEMSEQFSLHEITINGQTFLAFVKDNET